VDSLGIFSKQKFYFFLSLGNGFALCVDRRKRASLSLQISMKKGCIIQNQIWKKKNSI